MVSFFYATDPTQFIALPFIKPLPTLSQIIIFHTCNIMMELANTNPVLNYSQ